MQPDYVDVMVAAYRVEQTPSAWLRGVLEAARPRLDRGAGVTGYFVDCSEGFRAWDQQGIDFFTDPEALFGTYAASMPLEVVRAVHTYAPAGYSPALPDEARPALEWGLAHTGPALGVNGIDASLRGAALAAFDPTRAKEPPTAAELARWAQVSAHLAAGARLVHRLVGVPQEPPEAVLAPDGRVLHAELDARDGLAREVLRDAVVAVERARTERARRDQDAAISGWKALVAGRWTLVDRFERDGRRYVLARPNDPRPPVSQLTHRERQVVAAAGLGHSNKLIAYELGLAPSSVATLLARARAKLGLESRVDLVRWARAQAARSDD